MFRSTTPTSHTTAALRAHNAPPDEKLVAAARANSAAFETLYDRNINAIYRYCLVRLSSPQSAEDATADVFLKALQGLPQFRDGLFVAWLFRIAHNVAVEARATSRHELNLDSFQAATDPGESPEEVAIRATERADLYVALDKLPDEQRTVLDLTLSGLKGEEIATIIGKSASAVKMLRWRAIQAVKTYLAGARLIEVAS